MSIMRNMKVSFMLLLISGGLVSVSPYTVPAEESTAYEVKTQEESFVKAENTEWKYKMENGKLYKRLWDKTQKKWLTGWILVG